MKTFTNTIDTRFTFKFQYRRDRLFKHPASGENNSNSVLKDYQVRQIRLMYRYRLVTQKSLSKSFNVGKSTINDIVNYRTWKHISPYIEHDEILTATTLKVKEHGYSLIRSVALIHAIMADGNSHLIDIIIDWNQEGIGDALYSKYERVIKLAEFEVGLNEIELAIMNGVGQLKW